jgi:hypothetical protein
MTAMLKQKTMTQNVEVRKAGCEKRPLLLTGSSRGGLPTSTAMGTPSGSHP